MARYDSQWPPRTQSLVLLTAGRSGVNNAAMRQE